MTLRTRLLLTLGGIIILLVVPAAFGLSQLQRMQRLAEQFEYIHADDINALGRLRADVAEFDRYQRNFVADPVVESHRLGMVQELTMMREELRFLSIHYADAVQPAQQLVDSLEESTDRVETLIAQERKEAATNYLEEVKPIIEAARASLEDIATALDQNGEAQVREARQVSAGATQTTLLAAVIALLLTIVLAIWTTNALTRPLRRLSEATAAVADGDFMAPEDLPYERTDEIGHLSRSFGSMTHRLAELDRLKAEFVSLASHELKTPINVIAGYSELLSEGLYGEMDKKQREVLILVQEQTRALTRLVNQLLDLSRFEAGGLRMEPQPVELGRMLREVEDSFRALATQKQIDFTVQVEPGVPEKVTIDSDRIRHEVLGNLLSNAFKFTPTGGEVTVRAWSRNGNVHLEVSDTGIGIPEDQLAHIFDKYYQVGSDAKAKGSGLGLAIAKHVMDAHGGRIEATSAVGGGTTFHMVLPPEPHRSGSDDAGGDTA